MFKTLFFFVILGFIFLFCWSVYNIVKSKNSNSTVAKPSDELDALINDLKLKIELAEQKSALGVEEAKLQLEDYKEKLKKAQTLKEKFKTI
jgi:predicted negative regulator of RcsB-dependent stress response